MASVHVPRPQDGRIIYKKIAPEGLTVIFRCPCLSEGSKVVFHDVGKQRCEVCHTVYACYMSVRASV